MTSVFTSDDELEIDKQSSKKEINESLESPKMSASENIPDKKKTNASDSLKENNEIDDDFSHAINGIFRLPNSARFGVYTAYKYYLKKPSNVFFIFISSSYMIWIIFTFRKPITTFIRGSIYLNTV